MNASEIELIPGVFEDDDNSSSRDGSVCEGSVRKHFSKYLTDLGAGRHGAGVNRHDPVWRCGVLQGWTGVLVVVLVAVAVLVVLVAVAVLGVLVAVAVLVVLGAVADLWVLVAVAC